MNPDNTDPDTIPTRQINIELRDAFGYPYGNATFDVPADMADQIADDSNVSIPNRSGELVAQCYLRVAVVQL